MPRRQQHPELGSEVLRSGKEIKTYDVAELVDYPSLMPYTSANYHVDWLGDGFEDSLIIKDGLFLSDTSLQTH